ncbi:calcium homeostasis endoplasmic reticulum protein isoform X2 [Pseudochaenichthys georgianus]|uniref:calcium homeostasis endoplasmic reticulum protein isoform X2 n=1 Tax=Pseudochaenichthys georgianus TaxID=52239 RepID=UPI00146AD834|nr:calcium homeostasis endoplasmic reticulum protein isoform X2 [Pseudochaenichthys georgianus]
MDIPNSPEDQELKNVIDKLAQFVARNGPEFEKMTMEKQKDNPKFSFLFGGDYFSYYKCKLAIEHQQHPSAHDGEEYTSEEMYQGSKDVVDILPPPMAMIAPLPNPPPAAPSMEDLIQQSQWNLQQQEQHMHTLRQEQVTAAIALAMEQQTQKLLLETQLDITEFDNLLQPIIDTCTKDAISGGKNWMFNNAKTPQHCELMTSHLRNRITADGAHFELCLHLIYLTNDVLHHCQRKQQKDLLAALQKVVVPIYCTSFLAVEEDKQQKITRLLQLWEKNGYFNDETIQMLQNPTLGLGQYQASLITEYAAVVQPIQLAFQQQIQALKAQHEEFVSSLKQQPQPSSVAQLGTPAEPEKTLPMTTKAGDVKPPISGPPQGDFDGAPSRPQDPSNPSGPSDISSNKAGWYDPQHMGPWNPNQPPPFDPNQPPPPCPPWNSHEGMWNEQRNQENWSGGPPREGGPWSGPGGSDQGPPSWNSYDQQPPWGNQPDQPPWGQREPPFPPRMQRPPHFRGPFPPHQQPPPFNQPPPPHSFGRFPPRFMQDDFPPRHHYDRPPYTPHRFDYAQGEFPGEMPGPPPHHHQNQRLPPPGMGPEHPPWGGSQHQDFGPPPHGFNGHSPHVRHRQHPVQDDPSLVPNVPYFDLPAGLMAPLVKLEDSDYKPLDPKDIRLPPPMPPSDRLLAAVEAFYSPPSHDRPRNSEGWEQNGLYEFFRAKMRAKRKKGHEKRNSVQGDSRSRSPSHSRGRSSSRSSSRSSKSSRSRSRSSGSHSQSRSRSYSRSRSRSRSRSSRSHSRSRSRSRSHSPSKTRHGPKTQSDSPPSTSVVAGAPSKLPADSRLGEENKGHQLLMKMGWSGSGGLGAKEQGIQDPIKGGDIRDKWDQYKGVGVSLDDPYENYRRNKSYNFVARMKAREEVNRETPEAPPTE